MADDALRDHLVRVLAWHDAHVDFDGATAGIPKSKRGQSPPGLPYSPWQLLEHLRRTQRDILEFCRNPDYVELSWPDDYWPPSAAPESAQAWDDSIAAFRADLQALQALATDSSLDLTARIPHGSGQTYLRELLLVADHNAYHIGQLVAVRRCLGIWTSG
jgi:uncharacterized damage-inducible protein DinB